MTGATGNHLTGLTAVITGGAQGLGLGIAEQLARDGAAVTIADVRQDKAEASAVALRTQDLNVMAAPLNIGDSTAVNRFFDEFVRRRKHLDILVNNAGVGQDVASVADLSDDEWERVLHVTMTGTFYCCRAAARIMERQERGC